jgi:hypothetical protein
MYGNRYPEMLDVLEDVSLTGYPRHHSVGAGERVPASPRCDRGPGEMRGLDQGRAEGVESRDLGQG